MNSVFENILFLIVVASGLILGRAFVAVDVDFDFPSALAINVVITLTILFIFLLAVGPLRVIKAMYRVLLSIWEDWNARHATASPMAPALVAKTISDSPLLPTSTAAAEYENAEEVKKVIESEYTTVPVEVEEQAKSSVPLQPISQYPHTTLFETSHDVSHVDVCRPTLAHREEVNLAIEMNSLDQRTHAELSPISIPSAHINFPANSERVRHVHFKEEDIICKELPKTKEMKIPVKTGEKPKSPLPLKSILKRPPQSAQTCLHAISHYDSHVDVCRPPPAEEVKLAIQKSSLHQKNLAQIQSSSSHLSQVHFKEDVIRKEHSKTKVTEKIVESNGAVPTKIEKKMTGRVPLTTPKHLCHFIAYAQHSYHAISHDHPHVHVCRREMHNKNYLANNKAIDEEKGLLKIQSLISPSPSSTAPANNDQKDTIGKNLTRSDLLKSSPSSIDLEWPQFHIISADTDLEVVAPLPSQAPKLHRKATSKRRSRSSMYANNFFISLSSRSSYRHVQKH